MEENDVKAVREALTKLQDSYERRDAELISDFRALLVQDDTVEAIGAAGIAPGEDGWGVGVDAACKQVTKEWDTWGDLKLDIADAKINGLGDVAWVAATGTVTVKIEAEEAYQNHLDALMRLAQEDGIDPKLRLLEMLRGGTNTLFEVERGDEYVWPLRFTAVLLRAGEEWQFHQFQFSFPTTRFPDERIG
jgi:hypothetical protein